MIEATGSYSLIQGSKVFYQALDMYITPTVEHADELVRIQIKTLTGLSVTGDIGGQHTIEVTYADLIALTPSGANELEEFYNLCEQAVVDYLESLPENISVTFTIA